MPTLTWEKIDGKPFKNLHRAEVPGGWLVINDFHGSVTFVPDPDHTWR